MMVDGDVFKKFKIDSCLFDLEGSFMIWLSFLNLLQLIAVLHFDDGNDEVWAEVASDENLRDEKDEHVRIENFH